MSDEHISLSYDRVSRIIARDPDAGMIYLGGLGGLGVGRMWTAEMEWHRDDPAYASAEIRSCPEEDKQRWA